MNKSDAYKILGVSSGATDSEIKTAFKKLAAKLHPDVNKSDNATEEFKKINEAYQYLQNSKEPYETYREPYDEYWKSAQWIHIQDLFDSKFGNNFSHIYEQTFHKPKESIHGTINISFIESVTGCKKHVKYKKDILCPTCKGKSYILIQDKGTKCDKCKGQGVRKYENKQESVENSKELPCNICKGKGFLDRRDPCSHCSFKGVIQEEHSAEVNIGAGIENNAVIDLEPFYKSILNPTAIKFKVNITEHDNMTKSGLDVTSNIKLSLLEALEGVSKEVETAYGKRTLKIPALRKHLDKIVAKGLGVGQIGSHIFILHVQYPDDVTPLINVLKNFEKSEADHLDIDVVVEEEEAKGNYDV